ncbi:MAG: hypothetical protein WCO84_08795, partial [bacterium]
GSTSTFTLAGTGAINVGTAFSTAYNGNSYATLTQNGTGAVTASVTATQNFAGGTSTGDVITIGTTGATAISGSIVGGSGGNNTAIFLGAPKTVADGGAFSGFQNEELSGSGVNGSWAATPFSNLLVTGLTQTAVTAATVGNSATFTDVAATTPLSVLAQSVTAGAAGTWGAGINAASLYKVGITGTYSTTTTYSLTVNGVTHTTVGVGGTNATTAIALAGAFTTAELIGAIVVVDGSLTAQIDVVNATSASASVDGVSTGTVTVANALSGVITETLSTAAAAQLGNTLNLNVGLAANTGTTTAVIAEANNQTIAINSVLGTAAAATVANSVIITDSTGTTVANQATTLTVSGAGNVTVSYSDIGASTNALATINAGSSSGTVNVSAVWGALGGLAITGGTGVLTASGSGTVTGQTAASYRTANDVITTGSGGGTITVGYAGAGAAAGTTKIYLAASTTALNKSTITDSSDATYGGRATINGYVSTASSATADILGIKGSTAQTLLTTALTTQSAPVTGHNYTVSNGVITFGSGYTTAEMLADTQAIVNAAGANRITAFKDATDTYVVSSGATTGSTVDDHIYTLSGVTNVTQIGGSTAALG